MQPPCLAFVIGISIISGLLGYNECSADKFDIPVPSAAQSAAENGLKSLQALRQDNEKDTELEAKRLGFDSSEEMAHAALSPRPLPVFVLTPKQVIAAIDSPSPISLGALAQKPTLYIYPVTAGRSESVRSSIMVTQSRTDASTWQAVQFGGKDLMALLDRYAQKSTPGLVLWLPGLSRYFLGLSNQNDLQLIPIVDEPGKGIVAGEIISGNKVFSKLKAEAERFLERAQYKQQQLREDKQMQQGGSK